MALSERKWTELRQPQDPNTGVYINDAKPVESEFTETKATGKDVYALMGAMKESSQATLQQAYNLDQSVGVVDLPDPAGTPVRIRANQYEEYRARGYGQKSTKTSFSVQGFGKMKQENVLKQTVRWTPNSKQTLTVYKDGRKELKEEAR